MTDEELKGVRIGVLATPQMAGCGFPQEHLPTKSQWKAKEANSLHRLFVSELWLGEMLT
jgi:hypothetical protein